jgi:hypothetical protein
VRREGCGSYFRIFLRHHERVLLSAHAGEARDVVVAPARLALKEGVDLCLARSAGADGVVKRLLAGNRTSLGISQLEMDSFNLQLLCPVRTEKNKRGWARHLLRARWRL